ncbi:MAG: acetate/propionate family kinase [Pirellulaceae bacterium]
MALLVLNAGSSTLKFSMFSSDGKSRLLNGIVDWHGDGKHSVLRARDRDGNQLLEQVGTLHDYEQAVCAACDALKEHGGHEIIEAIGHRVVHGGEAFLESVELNEEVVGRLNQLTHLAPLHNPPTLRSYVEACRCHPDARHFAVFDTTFFTTLPEKAVQYPVPIEWRSQFGIRRFGFHGLSHDYCSRRVAGLHPQTNPNTIICHLGSGCSVTAIHYGRPVATSMGFTPLEGLMMSTRSGSIDPGILLFLIREGKLSLDEVERQLQHESGLLGVSGVSGDFRQVEQAAANGNERAHLAIQMFTNRIRETIGAYAVTLGGVDALVFTAGIGENATKLREEVCHGLECIGIFLDHDINRQNLRDENLATTDSRAAIYVIATQEDRVIAEETARMLNCTE